MRIGIGYDVHRLGEGRDMIIGGVRIPYELGLVGHSDADVLLHAIMDAMLGAAALGDIGRHFPDTDETYKGISSMKLLEKVRELIEDEGYFVGNIDATIIAQKPKMRPYIDEMRKNVAQVLGLDLSCINIKATTEEGLGFTGAMEGISSQAVCMLISPANLVTRDVTTQGFTGNFTPACGSCCGNCPALKERGDKNADL